MKNLVFSEPDKLWFTSDTHFGHANILKYCERPFKHVDHMDECLIEGWNALVSPDDYVLHVGDFCWGDEKRWEDYLKRINGRIILVKGNHDLDKNIPFHRFSGVYDGFVDITVHDEKVRQLITLCHFPMMSWNQSHRGSWQLFGHWHNGEVRAKQLGESLVDMEVSGYVKEEYFYAKNLRPTQYDVGVDGNNFTPISYETVKKIIKNRIELRNDKQL